MINRLVNDYIREIKNDLNTTKYLISQLHYKDKEIIEDLYVSVILRMCIKYESWTSEIYKIVHPDHPIEYNHPWRYTRQFAERFNVDIQKEYKVAHDLWEFYNSLKHINYKTRIRGMKIEKKYKLTSIKEVANFICISLVDLLEKFNI